MCVCVCVWHNALRIYISISINTYIHIQAYIQNFFKPHGKHICVCFKVGIGFHISMFFSHISIFTYPIILLWCAVILTSGLNLSTLSRAIFERANGVQ